MSAKARYEAELKRIHREYGQFRRYIDGAPTFEELTGYRRPKKITEGSIKRLREIARKGRGKWEQARRQRPDAKPITPPRYRKPAIKIPKSRQPVEEARMIIANFLEQFDNGTNVVLSTGDYQATAFWTNVAQRGAINLNEAVHQLIERAIERNGVQAVAKGLKEFTEKYGDKIERYAYSIIDTETGGFNTNLNWHTYTPEGSVGRERFKKFTKALCDAVGMPAHDQVILAAVGRKA